MSISGSLLGGAYRAHANGELLLSQSPFLGKQRQDFGTNVAINGDGTVYAVTERLPGNNVQVFRNGAWQVIAVRFAHEYVGSMELNTLGLGWNLDMDSSGDALTVTSWGIGAFDKTQGAYVQTLAPGVSVLAFVDNSYRIIQTFDAASDDWSMASSMSRDGKTLALLTGKKYGTGTSGVNDLVLNLYSRVNVTDSFAPVRSVTLQNDYALTPTRVAVSEAGSLVVTAVLKTASRTSPTHVQVHDPVTLATTRDYTLDTITAASMGMACTQLGAYENGLVLAAVHEWAGSLANTNPTVLAEQGKIDAIYPDGTIQTLIRTATSGVSGDYHFGYSFAYSPSRGYLVTTAPYVNTSTGDASNWFLTFQEEDGVLLRKNVTYLPRDSSRPGDTQFITDIACTDDGIDWLYGAPGVHAEGENADRTSRYGIAAFWRF